MLSIGRVVNNHLLQVRNSDQEFGWGIVVNFKKKQPKPVGLKKAEDSHEVNTQTNVVFFT